MYNYIQSNHPEYSPVFFHETGEFYELVEKNKYANAEIRDPSVRYLLRSVIYNVESSVELIDSLEISHMARLYLKIFFYNSIYSSIWDTVKFEFWDDIINFIFRTTTVPAKTIEEIDLVLKKVEYRKYDSIAGFMILKKFSKEFRSDFSKNLSYFEKVLKRRLEGYSPQYYQRELLDQGKQMMGIYIVKSLNRMLMHDYFMVDEFSQALAPIVNSWRQFGLRDYKTSLIGYPISY